jgi:hypothetical protein
MSVNFSKTIVASRSETIAYYNYRTLFRTVRRIELV